MVSVIVADGLAGDATYRLDQATGSIEGASLAAFNTGTAAGVDIVELTGWNTAKGNLATDFTTGGNGTELLKGLVSGSGTAASITSDGANDIFYLIAYDTNVTVIYQVDGTTNPNVAADILPIAMFNSVIADGAFVQADFLMTS